MFSTSSCECDFDCAVLFFMAISLCSEANRDNLPGFNGPLPFSLETGYLEVNEEKGVELFYYFVELEKNPEEDPLVLWLIGGHGYSSLFGLAYEIGPLGYTLQNYVDGLPSLYYKTDSWTQLKNPRGHNLNLKV